MDAELQRLIAKTRTAHGQQSAERPTSGHAVGSSSHRSIAPTFPAAQQAAVPRKRKRLKADAADAGPSPGRPRLAPPPSFAERDLFFSASADRVHTRAPMTQLGASGAPRDAPVVQQQQKQQQKADFKEMAVSVELYGSARLEGLSKKDQKARERQRLGLQPEKPHKRPYKQLMELRKKQRGQDAVAAALAKEAGNTVRKQAPELLRAAERAKFRADDGPTDGVNAGSGVLHVNAKQIRAVRFHSKKGGGGGGKGKGGRGGGGKGKGGRGGGGKGKGGRGKGGRGKGGGGRGR